MSILLLAMGSRGDVQPFLALAHGLRSAGHSVRLGVTRDQADWVREQGVPVEEFDIDLKAASRTGAGLAWESGGSRGMRHEWPLFRRLIAELSPVIAEGVARMVRGEEDLVVSGAMTFHGATVATQGGARRIPHVLGLLAPTAPASDGRATMYAARPEADSPLNQLASGVGALGAFQVFRGVGRGVQERLGLARRTAGLPAYLRHSTSVPVLLGVSEHVVPVPTTWSPQVRTTGWWRLPTPTDWEPDIELVDFLAAGPAPVYVGFGSMASDDPAATVRDVLQALEATGQRGLISAGWSGLVADELPDSVHPVGQVPHEWLFAQTRAVVHHGGAGTTGAAVHSGRPQVVVPHVADQFYFARRIADLGVGPAPLLRHELSAESLASAITFATSDETSQRARELGDSVAGQDGVAAAVTSLTGLLSPR